MKRIVIGIAFLALAACNPVDRLASCIAQEKDPRPFVLEIGDIVRSSIYRQDMTMTVVNPIISVNQLCTSITAEVVATDPTGATQRWVLNYNVLEVVKLGALHD
jgi:hypothetical protein